MTAIRLKRLFECIRENQDEVTAAKVIYASFGAAFSSYYAIKEITALERQYVYVARGLTINRDSDSIIGLNLSKLFMDDRMNILRQTINAAYNELEARTYGWFRSHRVLYLGFGLSGQYDEMMYGAGHFEGVNPGDFVEIYFRGGSLSNSTRLLTVPAFTIERMTDIVIRDIKKGTQGSFDDDTLNYMINSNLALRRAYTEFQDNKGDATFENNYFKDATLTQRYAIKKEAIIEVLKTYNYISQRNDRDQWE